MRIHRVFVASLTSEQDKISLDNDTSRYLLQVLRCKDGQELQLFNGAGLQCNATLQIINRKEAVANLGSCTAIDRESPLTIHLALGISKGERMDTAIQKAVELGVSHISPLQTEYSVVNLSSERAAKRLQHWQGIITSACEQCGRNTLPVLHPVQSLHDWLTQPRPGVSWMFSPQSQQTLSKQNRPVQGVSILIGPEGGFSDNEISQAIAQGVVTINFGPRILRTETAAIAGICALQTLWGDLG